MISGQSYINGISFTDNEYTVIARYKRKEIVITNSKITTPSKTLFNDIPLLRGFFYMSNGINTKIPSQIMEFTILYIILYFGITYWPLSLLFLLLSLCAFRMSTCSKYHAAEHMTIITEENNQELSTEVIARQKRTHIRCGTHYISSLIIMFLISVFVNIPLWIKPVLILSLGIEIYLSFRKQLWITKPLYWISTALQYMFFTAKPKTKHIEIAIAAMSELLRDERSIGK